MEDLTLCVFDYSVLFKWHGSISTYCISLSFGISIHADVRPKGKIWNLIASWVSASQLWVCKSASQSLQVASLLIACLWVIGRCAHFNVKLLHLHLVFNFRCWFGPLITLQWTSQICYVVYLSNSCPIVYSLFKLMRQIMFLLQDDKYSLMFVNNNWYLFLRLHQILCDRLHKISSQAKQISEEENKCKQERKESTAIALRLKAPSMYHYFTDHGVS